MVGKEVWVMAGKEEGWGGGGGGERERERERMHIYYLQFQLKASLTCACCLLSSSLDSMSLFLLWPPSLGGASVELVAFADGASVVGAAFVGGVFSPYTAVLSCYERKRGKLRIIRGAGWYTEGIG